MSRSCLILLLPSLLLSSPLVAIDIPGSDNHPPRPVIDQTGLLTASGVSQLSQIAEAIHAAGCAQIQLWIIPSLDGDVIEELSIRAAEKWKLGDAQKDNGVLLLVAAKDRQVRIEVGNGIEGLLTDAKTARIIRHTIVPAFRQNDYAGGLAQAMAEIKDALACPVTLDLPAAARPSQQNDGGIGSLVIILFFLIPFIFHLMRMSHRGRDWYRRPGSGGYYGGWSGGGLSGGGWSGGGGGFSGGGASGRW